jgi:hypothetical protein
LSCLSPYKVPQIIPGRFLQWTAISYFLENQTEPIEICADSTDPCNYQFPDLTETYPLPIQTDDVVRWIMNRNEISLGSAISDLRIAVVQEGVLVADNIGTISEETGGTQLYCTATIPCLPEGCNYQLVVYDNSITPSLECGAYAGNTLQQVITAGPTLGQVLTCTLNDFL